MGEVGQHGTKDKNNKRIWTYYRSGVYDITDYVRLHPGGDIILQAAGQLLAKNTPVDIFLMHGFTKKLQNIFFLSKMFGFFITCR